MHKRAHTMVSKINEHFGASSILAVQLATAPSVPVPGVSSSCESLSRSLDQILAWDWMGAKIVIEHCDSHRDGHPHEKGFMSIDDEINTLLSFSDASDIGLTINWARSVVEGRSISTVIKHINMAKSSNLLSGLMFSGTSDGDKKYGAYKDNHMPFSKCYNEEYFEKNSLLKKDAIIDTLSAVDVNSLDYMGVKLLAMPLDSAAIDRRVGVNCDAIMALNHALEGMSAH